MTIHIIGDTHFGHANMIPYCGRPEEFDEIIIKNWNKKVNYDDTVIVLGDVIMGMNSQERLPSILSTLPGKKILVRGNHDVEKKWGSAENFEKAGFDFVVDSYVLDDIAFSHCPLTPLPKQNNFNWQKEVKGNIHAHFHNSPESQQESTDTDNRFYDRKYYLENRSKYYLVEIESELRPFTLQEILDKWEKGGETK